MINILGEVWKTLARYQADFPDERTCEAYLFRKRWPNGFICPRCGGGKYWQLTSRACTYQCSRSRCRQQTSITAGTVMQRSKLTLMIWFWAAGIVANHPSIFARSFRALFGISPQSARLLRQKFDQLLASFRGSPLEGLVQVDHAKIQLRAAAGSVDNSISGKVIIAVALEEGSSHIRAGRLQDGSATCIEAFVRSNIKPGATLLTTARNSHLTLTDYLHDPCGIGKTLPGTEAILKRAQMWFRRYNGLSREAVADALAEFVTLESQRANLPVRKPSFDTLIELALRQKPTSHWDIVGRENPRKGMPTIRRKARFRKTATGMRQDGSGATLPFAATVGPHSSPDGR